MMSHIDHDQPAQNTISLKTVYIYPSRLLFTCSWDVSQSVLPDDVIASHIYPVLRMSVLPDVAWGGQHESLFSCSICRYHTAIVVIASITASK